MRNVPYSVPHSSDRRMPSTIFPRERALEGRFFYSFNHSSSRRLNLVVFQEERGEEGRFLYSFHYSSRRQLPSIVFHASRWKRRKEVPLPLHHSPSRRLTLVVFLWERGGEEYKCLPPFPLWEAWFLLTSMHWEFKSGRPRRNTSSLLSPLFYLKLSYTFLLRIERRGRRRRKRRKEGRKRRRRRTIW